MIRRILIGDTERVLLFRKRRFMEILEPGEYWLYGTGVEVIPADVNQVEFTSEWANYLVASRPDVAGRYFTIVETGDADVAVVYFDGKVARVIGPGRRALFWKGPIAVTFERINVSEAPEVPERLVAPLRGRFLVHVDLHETTDTDETEFRPALAARDGKTCEPGIIPDGFYVVDDSENPQPEFQRAIIDAVAKVTHIAPADERNEIIGSPVLAPGVIEYPLRKLGLCAGITGARFTTTEVYPDSPRTTPEQCNLAQVAAVCAAIEFALQAAAD